MAMLDPMTSREREDFLRDGYLLIPGVLSSGDVDRLKADVDTVLGSAVVRREIFKESTYHPNSFKVARILDRSAAFDFLIDHPAVLGKLVSVMGHHLQVMGSEIFVRGPADEAITGFHTDLGEALQQILPTRDNLLLSVKAQFFLTDLSRPDAGNFWLMRGTHMQRVATPTRDCMIEEVNRDLRSGAPPAGAVQVLARPGDAILFPWTLWHAVAPNRTDNTRLSLTLRYGQLALRPLESYTELLRDPSRNFTPRQRRLLGDVLPVSAVTGSPNYWKPSQQRDIIFGDSLEAAPV